MHNYDANLAALSLGEADEGIFGTAAQVVQCHADGGTWDDESEICFFSAPPRTTGAPPSRNGGGSGGIKLTRTDEVLFAVGAAGVIAAAVYFWRR